jgi:hypothetical protein
MIDSILDRHGFGVDGFLAGYALQPGEDAAVVVLVALHGEAAFFVFSQQISVGPDQSGALRNQYRDPSLGVARCRARLRCLRMTVNNRRLYRSLNSATRNDFLGEDYGALRLGGRRTVLRGLRGVKGIWSGSVRAVVGCGA